MQIPLVDLKAQYANIKVEMDGAIQRVLDHAGFIMGEEVRQFERAYAEYVGASGAVGIASGTAALQLSLLALGVEAGDEVICPAHTFMATAEAISNAGARPVFVDIDPRSFNLDANLIEGSLTPYTKGIIAVQLYGQACDMGAINALAKKYGLWVVEDAAQAHGAAQNEARCGTLGDLACFSFFPGKNLGAYGDAGGVTGNDEKLLNKVKALRDHGRSSKYEHAEVGFGERLDALQAAVLGVKLRYLEDWTEARRHHARRYNEGLAGMPVRTPFEAPGMRHVYHLYVLRTGRRDALLEHLRGQGVGAGVHYPIPLHRQPAYLKQGYGVVRLPETERAAEEILSLPIYPEMTNEQIDYVIARVREFFA